MSAIEYSVMYQKNLNKIKLIFERYDQEIWEVEGGAKSFLVYK